MKLHPAEGKMLGKLQTGSVVVEGNFFSRHWQIRDGHLLLAGAGMPNEPLPRSTHTHFLSQKGARVRDTGNKTT